MLRNIEKLSADKYDLLVIGGGINGAAVANIACDYGIKTALLEKNDFAGGTSSKTTKLIHGGLRYLENLEFGLVKESLRERDIQLKVAPHLVKPLGFVIPVYKNDKRPLGMIKLGVSLYDALAGKYAIQPHKSLSANEVVNLEPGVKKEGLRGGVMYYDAQMDDARLCLENILCAAEKRADVANYAEAVSFLKEKGKIIGVKAKDNLKNNFFEVRAKSIICAVGPWTNLLLKMDDPNAKDKVRTTKGIHIVYPQQISNNALLIPSDKDNRVFFIIPWLGCSLIGTTDTDYTGSPDEVMADASDIDYLRDEARRVFPSLEFNKNEIIASFVGLRPLVRKGGSASKVSRRHLVYKSRSGIIFVMGGKYTTYRKIAQDCVSRLTAVSPKKEFRLYASAVLERPKDIAGKYNLEFDVVNNLMAKYGSRYQDVLKLTEEEPGLKERICPGLPIIKAQIIYSTKVEMAQSRDDVIFRRLSIGYCTCRTRQCDEAIDKLLAPL